MSNETNNLGEYIAKLQELTRLGDIGWFKATPAAYAAIRDTASGRKRMTILRATRTPAAPVDKRPPDTAALLRRALSSPAQSEGGEALRRAYFLFLVEGLGGPSKQTEMMIDTREKPELYEAFERLFEAAKSSVDAQSARILKELVG